MGLHKSFALVQDLIVARNALVPKKEATVQNTQERTIEGEDMVLYLKDRVEPGLYYCSKYVENGEVKFYTSEGEFAGLWHNEKFAPEGSQMQLIPPVSDDSHGVNLAKPYNRLYNGELSTTNFEEIKIEGSRFHMRVGRDQCLHASIPKNDMLKRLGHFCWYYVRRFEELHASALKTMLSKLEVVVIFRREKPYDWCGAGRMFQVLGKAKNRRIEVCLSDACLPETLLHEFSHVIASTLPKKDYYAAERLALEEAFCEYSWRVMLCHQKEPLRENLWSNELCFDTYSKLKQALEEGDALVLNDSRSTKAHSKRHEIIHNAGGDYVARLKRARDTIQGADKLNFDLTVFKCFCTCLGRGSESLESATSAFVTELGMENSASDIFGDFYRTGLPFKRTKLQPLPSRVKQRVLGVKPKNFIL